MKIELTEKPVRKLYIYDHCPFCVRVRMLSGLKNIPFELIVLDNDDEETPISMTGQKMLPILEDEDGFMGESLEIVRKLDYLTTPHYFDGEPNPALIYWLQKWGPVINALIIPRTPNSIYLEFKTASARSYFTQRKEIIFGSFQDLLKHTDVFKQQLIKGFAELEPILSDLDKVDINDILLFPMLRSLKIIPELEIPASIEAYIQGMSKRSNVPLVRTLEA